MRYFWYQQEPNPQGCTQNLCITVLLSNGVPALQDISKADNVFREEYTGDNNSLGRWYGNNNENQFMAGNEQTYYVHFDCKKGESHTLITGKDSYSNSAAYLEDFSAYYPNEEDVVGNLTIIVSTKDYKLKTNSNSAVRVTVKNGVKVNEEKDSFYNSNDESDSYNNTVSHTWNRVLPDEQFNLYVYGKIR